MMYIDIYIYIYNVIFQCDHLATCGVSVFVCALAMCKEETATVV